VHGAVAMLSMISSSLTFIDVGDVYNGYAYIEDMQQNNY